MYIRHSCMLYLRSVMVVLENSHIAQQCVLCVYRVPVVASRAERLLATTASKQNRCSEGEKLARIINSYGHGLWRTVFFICHSTIVRFSDTQTTQ